MSGAAPSQSPVFDAHAVGYDDVATSALGTRLRERVHAVVSDLVDESSSVLDLGCGTGLDAHWMSDRVRRVVACEPSQEMAAIAKQRCAGQANVRILSDGPESLAQRQPHDRFDLVLANFGAVNCMDLDVLANLLESSLNPEGRAVFVTMPRVNPLERMVGVLSGDVALARRRTSGPSDVAGYEGLNVTYLNATELAERLPLTLVSAQSLGLVLPPFEWRRRVEDRPRLLDALAWFDRQLGSLGGRLGWGDHLIAVFRLAP